jgi:hypothetical protein
MRAVRGREGVIDVDVAESREARREVGVVLLLARMEARVLDKDHGVRRLRVDEGAVGVLGEDDLAAKRFLQRRLHDPQAHLRIGLALGSPEVCEQHRRAALRKDVRNRRHDPLDARGVRHAAPFNGDVHVHARQHPLAVQVHVVERLPGHAGLPSLATP